MTARSLSAVDASHGRHDQPWTLHGATDLHNAVQLCAFHHHRTHDHDFTHERLPNGDIRYHRRV